MLVSDRLIIAVLALIDARFGTPKKKKAVGYAEEKKKTGLRYLNIYNILVFLNFRLVFFMLKAVFIFLELERRRRKKKRNCCRETPGISATFIPSLNNQDSG